MATILSKKHSRHSTPSNYKSQRVDRKKHVAPILPSRFVPKLTPENEPLWSYPSATKKRKEKNKKKKKIEMEKIEGRVNFSLKC